MAQMIYATPMFGVHRPLTHLSARIEGGSDEAAGEAFGMACKAAREAGHDIEHPDFMVLMAFGEG